MIAERLRGTLNLAMDPTSAATADSPVNHGPNGQVHI
jgi:hypothetical protein